MTFIIEAIYSNGEGELTEHYYLSEDRFGSPYAFEIDGKRYVVSAWVGKNEAGRDPWHPWLTPPSGYRLIRRSFRNVEEGAKKVAMFNELTGEEMVIDVYPIEGWLDKLGVK